MSSKSQIPAEVSRSKWKYLKIFALILLGATIGPILYGVIASFFWERHSEATDRNNAAAQVYEAVSRPTNFYPLSYSLPVHDPYDYVDSDSCVSKLKALSRYAAASVKYSDIALAPLAFEQNAKMGLESHDRQKIRDLPYPVIGGLIGCQNSTLLSPLCTFYARNIIMQTDKNTIREIISQTQEDFEPLSCVLTNTTTAELLPERL